jgi:parvulin-like peptidyl-prolyl isomerase
LLIAAGAAAMFMPRSNPTDATRAHVAHILVKVEVLDEAGAKAALDKITSLREQIVAGANFAKLAAEYSDDPLTASSGGDLGWVHRGEMTDAVDAFIWTARLGEVSMPIITEVGLHLIIVHERQISKADRYEMDLKNRVLHEQPGADAPAQ